MGIHGKILIEIFLPASGKSYDVFVLPEIKIEQLIKLLDGVLTDLSLGVYTGREDTLLCNKNTGIPIDWEKTIKDNGVINGTQLMLI